MSRRVRLLLGAVGILVGIAGLWGVVMERRAAKERQRVLAVLAQNFRQRDQGREGQTFRPGDHVRIVKWSGTFKPEETGAAVEVQADEGRIGVVVGGEKQIVRVRWLPQKWKESDRDHSLDLPEFEATIHVSYLEHLR